MTVTSDNIKKLISYAWNDWEVTAQEQKMVIDSLRSDPDVNSTITDLKKEELIDELVYRVYDLNLKNSLIQILGGGLNNSNAALLTPYMSKIHIQNHILPYFSWLDIFKICNSFVNYFKRNGMIFNTGAAPVASIIGTTSESPYSGSGATGTNPVKQDIPIFDQIRLATKHAATTKRYKNPVGSLTGYLSTLSSAQKLDQVTNLVRQPVSSVFPDAYISKPPSRIEVIKLAGKIYKLQPALITGFILAEQRDQSAKEDAADYKGAVSIKNANTSIGLGQIVVSTAKSNNLFSDLLPPALVTSLNHKQIATLLASDEFNIFGVAKYLRMVANSAATISPVNLAKTKAVYPGVNITMYAMDSSVWPADNIKALGSEYTSKAWDGRIFSNWGDFVYTAYTNVKSAGIP